MLPYKNLHDKQLKIKSRELSLTENVQSFLTRIDKNSDINAFNFVFDDQYENAKLIEEKIHNG
ncbi:MAG: Asp-tRNA(Asn)/Glu-tRNA(Gln) amidotransferase subunit GatA, partial [Bacteroidota bacterium]